MPLGDGTGPLGNGPGTGRGMGGCLTGKNEGRDVVRGRKLFGGIDFEELKKQAKKPHKSSLNEKQKLETLKNQLSALQDQMDEIRREIEELENK
jgi:predicted RNase H-like nuclease (RuvC/YqgF family)